MQTIKSIGVLSLAKMSAAVNAIFGLLLMPIFLLISLAGAFAGARQRPLSGAIGVAFALLMPVFYGVIGFVSGVIGGLVYNLIAKWLGGIEIELGPPQSAPIATSATAG